MAEVLYNPKIKPEHLVRQDSSEARSKFDRSCALLDAKRLSRQAQRS
jgi:hypothetical protein